MLSWIPLFALVMAGGDSFEAEADKCKMQTYLSSIIWVCRGTHSQSSTVTLTSSIAVTEVGKAPDVAKTDGEWKAGEDELDLVSPHPSVVLLSPRDADALVVISSINGDPDLRSVSLQPHILEEKEKSWWDLRYRLCYPTSWCTS